MKTRITKSGWVIEINSNYTGGITCREELYKWEKLSAAGFNKNTDPAGDSNGFCTNAEYMRRYHHPCKILKKGFMVT